MRILLWIFFLILVSYLIFYFVQLVKKNSSLFLDAVTFFISIAFFFSLQLGLFTMLVIPWMLAVFIIVLISSSIIISFAHAIFVKNLRERR